MQKYFYVAIALICTATKPLYTQVNTPIINTEITNANNQPMLMGHCSIEFLKGLNYAEWFLKNEESYLQDSSTIEKIKPLLKKKRIDLFFGTWCGDSKSEVPKMIKILYAAGFDTSKLALVAVGNSAEMYKMSPEGEEKGRNIRRVPTLIIYDKKGEMGRIIESPIISLEKDLLSILKREGYIPHYAHLKE